MQKLCESLTEHKVKIINFEKENVITLKNEEYKWYSNQTSYHM